MAAIALDVLAAALATSWSSETSYASPLEAGEQEPHPASGQCGTTAMVVQDHLGGDLLMADVVIGGRQRGVHYWNRLPDGTEVDLTREQFGGDAAFGQPVTVTRPEEIPPDVARPYLLLSELVRTSLAAPPVLLSWRVQFEDAELEALHAGCFGHDPRTYAWGAQLAAHSLGWVCAHRDDRLIGFVNVAWDGGCHAFILDTSVAAAERGRGLGSALVAEAAQRARDAGCEWLHADFPGELSSFYLEACGLTPSAAGLLHLDSAGGAPR